MTGTLLFVFFFFSEEKLDWIVLGDHVVMDKCILLIEDYISQGHKLHFIL